MSTLPIEELIAEITSDQLYDKVVSILETAGVPASSWRQGSVARSMLAAGCEVGAQGISIFRTCIRGCFLLLGEGVALRSHAKDVYDVDFIAATFASGTVTLTNSGGAVYNIGANELVVKSSRTGARFTVTDAFVLNPNSSVTVNVMAVESGSASSVGPDEIDTLETTLAKVTVANASALIGRDAEADPDLVKRCKAKKGTWSPFGPRDAYEYAVLSSTLADGTPTNISRVAVSRYSSTGTVKVVVATPSGAPTADELAAAVEACEAQARPSTVTCTVEAAATVATSHTITIWAKGGVEATILALARKALADLIASWPIGGRAKADGGQGYLYADAIAAAIIASSPEVFDVDGVGDDIALAYNQVATDTTTFTVRIL